MTTCRLILRRLSEKIAVRAVLVGALVNLSVIIPIQAQVRDWKNSSGGSYHTATNWSPNDVPNTPAETAHFNLPASYIVSFFAGDALNVGGLVLDDGRVLFQAPGVATYTVQGSVEVRGSDFTLFESAPAGRIDLDAQDTFVTTDGRLTFDGGSKSTIDSLFIGDTGSNNIGEVRVQGGSSLKLRPSETLSLGGQTSGTSKLTVTGNGSLLDAEFGNELKIGSNGTGIMEVLSRGQVKAPLANVDVGQPSAGFNSRLTLDGQSSFTTYDATNGRGFTNIRSFSTVEVLGGSLFEPGFLRVETSSSVLVDGPGSTLRVHGSVGLLDTSSMVIQGGATAEFLAAGGSAIADRGSLTVTGAGTRLLGNDAVTLDGSTASVPVRVHVLDGAVVEPAFPGGLIEFLASSGYDEMVINGAGSAYHVGDQTLRLATDANSVGTLRVSNGGTMTAFGLTAGTNAGAVAAVDLDAGTMVLSGDVKLSKVNGGAAVVNVLPGSLLDVGGEVTLGSGAVLNLYGGELRLATLADLTDQGGKVDWNNGTVRVVANTTLTPVAAGLLLPAGAIQFGQTMHIDGNLSLQATVMLDGGTLAVEGLTNESLLQLKAGTFEWLDSELVVGNGEALGGAVDLGPNLTIKVEGQLTNNGLITGDGTLFGNLANQTGGIVRVEQGKSLAVTGGASHSNSGNLELLGGRLDFSGDLSSPAGGNVAGRGTLAVAGTWNNAGNAAFSAGFTDVFGNVANTGGGRIIATGGATVTFYGDVVHNGDEIRTSANSNTVFLGDVTGAGPFTGTGTNYFEGNVHPGNSPAEVTFAGDVVFGALADLTIELGGTTPGSEFDFLDIAGSASLDGGLEVVLIGGFTPALGQSFPILRAAGGVAGTFATQSLPDLGSLLDLRLLYSADGVTLAVVPDLAGDYNANGVVDAADYVVWRKTLGQTGTGLAADGDGSGEIDPGDYAVWRANFGKTAGSAAATTAGHRSAAVPEPASAVVALVGAATLLLASRRVKADALAR